MSKEIKRLNSQSNKRIKILQVIETLGLGGAERLLSSNLNFLNKERFENVVISIYSDKNSEIICESLKGIKIERIYPKFKHDIFTIGMAIYRSIKRNKIDIIHTQGPVADIYGKVLGGLTGCPVISSVHTARYETLIALGKFKKSCLRLKLFLMRCIDIWTLKFCPGGLIAVSEFVKKYIMEKMAIPAKKIRILYNATDTEYYNNIGYDMVLEKRRELGITDNSEKIILTVGRNIAEKGQKYAIEAVRILVLKGRMVRLIIVGIGHLRSELERYCYKLGMRDHVIFLGLQKDMRVLFQMCDAFVFTPLYEGFGIAQIEAMSMRKPVVAFDVGPIPEIVKDGISGILVEPANPDELARSVEVILDDPALAERMGLAGRRLVEERFDIRKNIKLLENIYLEVYNKRHE